MATPPTASKLLQQLNKWSVPYREYRNWRTHNRNHMGLWGPVNGVMIHHTGNDNPDQRAPLYNGVSGLPGPLCHFGVDQEGAVHLIGWGRTNHAGLGDPDVLDAVIAENYGDYPPTDNQSSVDGNARFYGIEVWYSGSHEMTAAQYNTVRKLCAALLDKHGWSEKSVIGHGEWGSPGKWDPGYKSGKMMDMAEVRKDIKATLKGQADTPAKPAPKPATPPREVHPKISLSRLLKAAKTDPPKTGTPVSYSGVKTVESALVKERLLSAKYSDGHFGTATKTAYAKWQKKCGYSGADADGLPGMSSLKRLGAKYNFDVTA